MNDPAVDNVEFSRTCSVYLHVALLYFTGIDLSSAVFARNPSQKKHGCEGKESLVKMTTCRVKPHCSDISQITIDSKSIVGEFHHRWKKYRSAAIRQSRCEDSVDRFGRMKRSYGAIGRKTQTVAYTAVKTAFPKAFHSRAE